MNRYLFVIDYQNIYGRGAGLPRCGEAGLRHGCDRPVLPESADEIELVGLVSNAVVLQSKYPEATILVDAACTDSFDKALHEKVLDVLEGFQVKGIHR